jgi:metallo-beta-lactamase family protein
MKLTFYGGATHVTGANYLLEAGGLRILVDCGMIQGTLYNDEMNYADLGYDPSTVDYLFVTHSHVDHMGRIPKLYRDGFRGVIYLTEPTKGITEVALPDTLDKITNDARKAGMPALYDAMDTEAAIGLFKGVSYRQDLKLNDHVMVHAQDSGHVLGSATWVFTVREEGKAKRIAFPGDIGNTPSILLHDIDYAKGVDYTLVESAYGNRFHEKREERAQMLLETITETVHRGGVLMIPSFAVERTQEILLEMDTMFEAGKLPRVPVFVDSPLAIAITKVYGHYSNYFNEGAREILKDNRGLFQFPWLTFTPSVAESKHINEVAGPKIIIAGSGMSQGGRIVHHESRYLPDSRNTILFVGYQVQGSLGRRIRDGQKLVRIMERDVHVRCHVKSIGAFSAHADQNGLMEYIRHANEPGSAEASQGKGTLKKCFVVQGELDAAQALAARARSDLGIDAIVPELGQSFDL